MATSLESHGLPKAAIFHIIIITMAIICLSKINSNYFLL